MIGIGYNMINELCLLPYLKENSGQMGFTLKIHYWMIQKMFVHWPETWFRKTAGSHLSHGFFNEENVCCSCSHGKGRGSRHTTFTHSALVSYSIVYAGGIWEMAASKGYLAFHSALLPLSRTYDQAVSPGSPLKEVLRLMWGASFLHSFLLWRWRSLEAEQ